MDCNTSQLLQGRDGLSSIPPSGNSPDGLMMNANNSGTIQSDITLEPFIPEGFQQIKSKRQKQKERTIKRMLLLDDIFEPETPYPKFQIMTFPGIDINTDLNVILADIEIKEKIGKAKKISKLNKKSLLIEVASKNQLEKLKAITTIAEQPVTIEDHKTMNFRKGLIFSDSLSQSTEAQICEKLSDQHVVKVERMKSKIGDKLENTNRYILTFNITKLPKLVKIAEWQHEIVNVYIPKPMRCMKCQRLGHAKKWCRREQDSCARCSKPGHLVKDCENEAYCINCNENHPPSSTNCCHV